MVTTVSPAVRPRAVILVPSPANPYSRALRVARSLAGAGYEVEIAAVDEPSAPREERDGEIVIRRYVPEHEAAISRLPGIRQARQVSLWPEADRGWYRTLRRQLRPADLYHACGYRTVGIALDSNVSGGSVFSVTVPIAKAINYTAAVTTATPLSRTSMSGALIVCIENDLAILDGMKTLLTAWDADVIAVTDPDAALEAIEAAGAPVTGLLVDYHLDRGNGVAAIRDIRRRFGANIPAILITADRSPHVRAAAREEKIAVLNKPVKPASLRALLGQWRNQQMMAAE